MPRLLSLLFAGLLLGCDAKPNPKAPPAAPVAKALGVGSPAPPLTVTRWLHGQPLEIKPGTAYVVDFWAVWCGPCLRAMPHLDELAREYAGKGVEFIAITTKDDRGNDLENVTQYVESTGKQYSFRFAWCEETTTFQNWFVAAGQDGIPCSFVVDKQGKIAFIGMPNELDDILPKIAEGTWRGQADLDEISTRNHRRDMIFYRMEKAGQEAVAKLGGNPKPSEAQAAYLEAVRKAAPAALAELLSFNDEYPEAAARLDHRYRTMLLQLRADKWDDAKSTAVAFLDEAAAKRTYNAVRDTFFLWARPEENPHRKHADIALKAARQMLELRGESDLEATLAMAEASLLTGDTAGHEAFAAKARALASADAAKSKIVEDALKNMQPKQ